MVAAETGSVSGHAGDVAGDTGTGSDPAGSVNDESGKPTILAGTVSAGQKAVKNAKKPGFDRPNHLRVDKIDSVRRPGQS